MIGGLCDGGAHLPLLSAAAPPAAPAAAPLPAAAAPLLAAAAAPLAAAAAASAEKKYTPAASRMPSRSPVLSAASSLVASLDVSEATKQLRKEKTTIVQCARGALYYLRDIKDSEAVCEPLDGGDESTHTLASLWQVTGYDSDEDGLARDPRVTNIKRQRTSAGSSCSALILQPSSALTAAIDKEPTAAERMLRKAFPLVSPHGTAHLEKALRELEKYELVCQGDDYADPECLATNSEALQYARANAVVKGLTWSISASLASRGRGRTLERLKAEPFLGESNARKVLDIVETAHAGGPSLASSAVKRPWTAAAAAACMRTGASTEPRGA